MVPENRIISLEIVQSAGTTIAPNGLDIARIVSLIDGIARDTKRTGKVNNEVSIGAGAVSVQVMIRRERLTAILDTGASPCVMDSNTAKRTKLFESMVPVPSDIYGLCNNPVPVLGYAQAKIHIEKGEPTLQRIQILDTDEPTLLLGRIFKQKLGSVEFDFRRGRVKLGKYWTDIECTVEGSTPLTRS